MNKTQNLLLNLLKDEKLNDYNGVGKGELIYSYRMQLFIISCKSLYYDNKGIRIDYDRYNEELKLLKYYINGTNKSLLNYFKGIKNFDEDDSIVYRITPIIVSNESVELIEEEIIKNISKTTSSPKTILKGLFTAYKYTKYLKNGKKDDSFIKDSLINFSIKEYSNRYSFMDKKFIINFERERIQYLGNYDSNYNNSVDKLLVINENLENSIKKDNYYKLVMDFSEFLMNLKRGSIDVEKFETDNLDKKFKTTEGNTFNHYLLGKSKIIKNDKSEFYIKTKYGLFKFRKI